MKSKIEIEQRIAQLTKTGQDTEYLELILNKSWSCQHLIASLTGCLQLKEYSNVRLGLWALEPSQIPNAELNRQETSSEK